MAGIPCAIVRGGTSKGVFLLEEHLPSDPQQRDAVLLQIMGSPDPRQIDGLGGADPLTSKVAIISRSNREGIDVEYESVEVGIAEGKVNHGLMCGNLIAGVGHFAIAEGLIEARAPATMLSIYCRSNGKIIMARIPMASTNGRREHGAALMDGEGGSVGLVFRDPGGTVTGRLLPAATPVTRLSFGPHRDVEVSIVDAGTLYALVRASDFQLSGNEDVVELDANRAFRDEIERLREQVAEHINQQSFFGAMVVVPRLVKVAIVVAPAASRHQADIVARIINTAKVHKAYAVSGGICLAAAAAIPDTLVRQITGSIGSPFTLRIAHPSGVLSLATDWSVGAQGTVIHTVEIQRTARIILRGNAYVPAMVKASAASRDSDASETVATVQSSQWLEEEISP